MTNLRPLLPSEKELDKYEYKSSPAKTKIKYLLYALCKYHDVMPRDDNSFNDYPTRTKYFTKMARWVLDKIIEIVKNEILKKQP